MEQKNLNNKVVFATKWSGVIELAAKLVAPVTTVALARILIPDAFGEIAMSDGNGQKHKNYQSWQDTYLLPYPIDIRKNLI